MLINRCFLDPVIVVASRANLLARVVAFGLVVAVVAADDGCMPAASAAITEVF